MVGWLAVLWACFPLGVAVEVSIVRAALFGLAESNMPGVSLLRAMPGFYGIEFITDVGSEPVRSGTRIYVYSGSTAGIMVSDLLAHLSMDPNYVGATRREAVGMLCLLYIVALVTATTGACVGMCCGSIVSRLFLRPVYWTVPVIHDRRWTIWLHAAPLTALWAYAVAGCVAAVQVVCSDTYQQGSLFGIPVIVYAVAVALSPAIAASIAGMVVYSRTVRAMIGPAEYLCDCGYECAPCTVCPECGVMTRRLPARLVWFIPWRPHAR